MPHAWVDGVEEMVSPLGLASLAYGPVAVLLMLFYPFENAMDGNSAAPGSLALLPRRWLTAG